MSVVADLNITICRITAQDVDLLRDVRLRALKESPTAFGSAYDIEAKSDPAQWHTRATRWTDPDKAVTFIATCAGRGVGMVAGVVGQDHHHVAWLVSMWVDPAVRRQGVGRRLIEQMLAWAALREDITTVQLHVTDGNDDAERLYHAIGFSRTGGQIPHPRFDTLCEHEMRLAMTFTRRVYALCRQIPRGSIATYGDLARALGSPGAARAVGMAMARNPDAPLVPCHRVVGADGSLHGYQGGLEKKAALLREEGVSVVGGKADMVCRYRFDG